ncbi:MerR family transcriptional regulator [Chitinimonas sp.]|uniref:MerR family transcriptional regulator n=1 Tax=Chitinimonas sp. TaxID=1934313 RepID=UPI002F94F4B8
MRIGELAKRSGLATSAIRFYETKGLLPPAKRGLNGYRDYPAETVAVLAIIADAQQAGFSLEEIKQILPADISSWRHEELMDTLRRKVADIEAMQARLKESKAHIESLIRLIEAKPDDMGCRENASRVMASLGLSKGK